MPGIYLHIPFCRKACSYCDFYFSTGLGNTATVTAAIVKELTLRHGYLSSTAVQSIYFGGGTPSLLSPEELASLFEGLHRHFSWDAAAEITLEANPDDITTDNLKAWKALGINRLSIGLQSFNDEELQWMNRAHSAQQSEYSVKLAQDLGFDNLSIDLIYGSKFQTLSSWEQTLHKAIALNTPHISSYNLTIEEKTALGLKHARGKEPAVSDELSSKQFLLLSQMLGSAGFVHYEISNFAKPGRFAQHNSNYWLQQPYLGLGPSAHSYNGHERQWNVKNNASYVNALNNGTFFFEKEVLQLNDRYNEYVLTRLRTIWGCDVNEIQRLFGAELADWFLKSIAEKKEFVAENNGVYTLKPAGRLQADGIAADLFK